MRVLMVNDMLFGGGAEQVMHILGNFLEHGGFEVYYYVGSKNPLALPKKCGNIYSVPIDPLYFQNYLVWGVNPLLGFHLNKVIAQIKPDIIHCHNISGMGLSPILLSLKYNIPCVVTVHDYWPVCPNRLLLRKDNEICNVDWNHCLNGCVSFTEKINLNSLLKGVFMKAMQRRAHMLSKVKLVAVSNYVKKVLKKAVPYANVDVIHNGVNEKEFDLAEPEHTDNIVLYVGGMSRFKGVNHFLRCADLVRSKNSKIKFAIAKGFVENEGILNLGLLSHSNLINLYRKVLCLVVPSLCPEPHPLSVIEAMASFRPVVAYKVGGIPESIANGASGFLVERGNIKELSDRVLYLIENPQVAMEMGRVARRIVKKRFTAKRMCEQYINVYEEAKRT